MKLVNAFMSYRLKLGRHVFLLIAAVYFALVLNVAMMSKMFAILEGLPSVSVSFALSIPLFWIAFFFFTLELVTLFGAVKAIVGSLIFISGFLMYAMHAYGIIVDRDMLENIVQTNQAEALTYINIPAALSLLIFAVAPLGLMTRIDIGAQPLVRRTLIHAAMVVISFVIFAAITLFFYKDYASIARNNSYLNKMIVPWTFLYDTTKFTYKKYIEVELPYRVLGADAVQRQTPGRPEVLVLVLGETARAANFSHGGYHQLTNEFTAQQDVFYYSQVASCGTATAISVPCMFSRLNREAYSYQQANRQDNLLDILQRGGADVVWINNNAGCKGVCNRVETRQIPQDRYPQYCSGGVCNDDVLVEELSLVLNGNRASQLVVVLHMMGSHGPTYYQRYPKAFAHFVPDCPRSDIQNCSRKQLINTYDNTIRYTDHVVNRVIELLQSHTDWNTSMVYISDHGESLGESGLYLHGLPYKLAPHEQKEVPWLLWLSDATVATQQLDRQCIRQGLHNAYSHDNYFDSILGLAQIQTEVYQAGQDIIAPCRRASVVGSSD